jgi:hypothetical protein
MLTSVRVRGDLLLGERVKGGWLNYCPVTTYCNMSQPVLRINASKMCDMIKSHTYDD